MLGVYLLLLTIRAGISMTGPAFVAIRAGILIVGPTFAAIRVRISMPIQFLQAHHDT